MPNPNNSLGTLNIAKRSLQGAVRAFAISMETNRPLNTFITIAWGKTQDFSDEKLTKRYDFLTRGLRSWLAREGCELAYIRVFERSARFGLHSHTLVHLPSEAHRERLYGITPGMVPGYAPDSCIVHLGKNFLRTENQRIGKFLYILKTYDPNIRIQENGRRLTIEEVYGVRHPLEKQNIAPIPCQPLRWSHTLGTMPPGSTSR